MTSWREKERARIAARRAVENGDLERDSHCSRCGERCDSIHGHHPDYSEPLRVEWVCPSCHAKIHAALAKEKTEFYKMLALPRYREWRRSVDRPVCGDSGGWARTARRPCMRRVDAPGERCRLHKEQGIGGDVVLLDQWERWTTHEKRVVKEFREVDE